MHRTLFYQKWVKGNWSIVVTVEGKRVFTPSTNYNDFQVVGAQEGQTIKIEIVRLLVIDQGQCRREEHENMVFVTRDGDRPYVTYDCESPNGVNTWEVIEERLYVVDEDPAPVSPTGRILEELNRGESASTTMGFK